MLLLHEPSRSFLYNKFRLRGGSLNYLFEFIKLFQCGSIFFSEAHSVEFKSCGHSPDIRSKSLSEVVLFRLFRLFFFKTGEYVVIRAFTGGEGVFGIFGNENLLLIFIVSEPADKAEALGRNCFNGDLFALSETFNGIIGTYVLAVDLEITVSSYPCAE